MGVSFPAIAALPGDHQYQSDRMSGSPALPSFGFANND
jgi:hypothetical protein